METVDSIHGSMDMSWTNSWNKLRQGKPGPTEICGVAESGNHADQQHQTYLASMF